MRVIASPGFPRWRVGAAGWQRDFCRCLEGMHGGLRVGVLRKVGDVVVLQKFPSVGFERRIVDLLPVVGPEIAVLVRDRRSTVFVWAVTPRVSTCLGVVYCSRCRGTQDVVDLAGKS